METDHNNVAVDCRAHRTGEGFQWWIREFLPRLVPGDRGAFDTDKIEFLVLSRVGYLYFFFLFSFSTRDTDANIKHSVYLAEPWSRAGRCVRCADIAREENGHIAINYYYTVRTRNTE